ncbi:hypothetical protein [Paenibacillus polymyxa]|uniref:Uncharacterized protein n=1 Tax=Paenibacillus polymyxa (strain SC2) TaxID=886882 RepID=A0A0D5ZCJ1_PAEPS|nr:hypothetical protein [Paenibacillus polymyxa]AKA44338.1 hypothetical protein PPSC2_26000 [Paenibacillus polymyxa SC2]WPQ59934.1 hypothetical protein SKN87_27210 [Paenibacillus polymyxa]
MPPRTSSKWRHPGAFNFLVKRSRFKKTAGTAGIAWYTMFRWDRSHFSLKVIDTLFLSLEGMTQESHHFSDGRFNPGVIFRTQRVSIIPLFPLFPYTYKLKPDFIKLGEIYGIDGVTVKRWELLYEGSIIDGVRHFNINYDREFHFARQRMLDLSILFLGIINFVIHYKEEVGVISKKTQTNTNHKKKNKKTSKNVAYVPSRIYSVNVVPDEPKIRKSSERHTEAWDVRGHIRQYKNGKVVWIKPYVKGNKDKVQPKEYKVTNIKDQPVSQ